MAVGNNVDPNFLWHGNLKINSGFKGFNFKFHIADVVEATARANFDLLAAAYRSCLPGASSIFFANLSKDNTAKDSRFARNAVGPGLYQAPGAPPTDVNPNRSNDCVLVRFEHSDGGSVTRKIGPIPDPNVDSDGLVGTYLDTTSPVLVAPTAPAVGDTWPQRLDKFCKAFMFYTHHLRSGHQPGTNYNYFTWTAAYVLRVGGKKGGRAFA